jgi:hypothetical protein
LYREYIVTFTKITYNISKDTYNKSKDLPSPSFSLPCSPTQNSFNRSCSIVIHEYIKLPPYSPSCTLPYALHTGTSPWQDPLIFPSFIFFLKKTLLFVYDSYTGGFIVTVPCVYVYIYRYVYISISIYIFYTPNWFISFIILSTLGPFLWWFQ